MIGVIPNLNKTLIAKLNNKIPIVEVYILPDCPWSKRALKLLDSFKIKYKYHIIKNDEEFNNISRKTSVSTFPQIFINNQFIGGYSELSNLSVKGDLNKLINLFIDYSIFFLF